MRRVPLVACWLLALCIGGAAAAEAPGGSGRIVEFTSLTPSRPSELLRGEGKPTTVQGELVLPAKGTRPYPAMVLSHGSGGIRADRERAWAQRLNALGVATFLVDGFGPRGIVSTAVDQSRLPIAASVADALSALRLLAADPAIDPARIGVMGFSKGGQVAVYTVLEPFRRALLGDGLRFALHVALYPSCSIPYLAERASPAPLLMLLGGADDYTPAEHCLRYAGLLRGAGSAARTVVLPGAAHGFDSRAPVVYLPAVQTARDCALDIELEPLQGRLQPGGEIVPPDAIPAHLRACVRRGASFGGNAEALASAIVEVEAAVRQHLLR